MKFTVENNVPNKVNELMNLADTMASSCASIPVNAANYDAFVTCRDQLRDKLKEFLEA